MNKKQSKYSYLEGRIYGVLKPLRKGYSTNLSKPPDREYIYKVAINNVTYYKVQIGRNRTGEKFISKIKYFKSLKEAQLFRDMLFLNKAI